MTNRLPPPVIDSAKLLTYAINDGHIIFTGNIQLYVGSAEEELQLLEEVEGIAICEEFGASENNVLLLFCNAEWESRGAIGGYHNVDEAIRKAELGYRGISEQFKPSPYSEEEVGEYLRSECNVDPCTRWWENICSFCGSQEARFVGVRASICDACIKVFTTEERDSDA